MIHFKSSTIFPYRIISIVSLPCLPLSTKVNRGKKGVYCQSIRSGRIKWNLDLYFVFNSMSVFVANLYFLFAKLLTGSSYLFWCCLSKVIVFSSSIYFFCVSVVLFNHIED